MTTHPNQKVIQIKKHVSKEDFAIVNNEDIEQASRDLSGAAFKLYMYLARNKDGFKLALSQVDVSTHMGISESAYHRAVKELSLAGYIVHFKGNVYTFNTRPSATARILPKMNTYSKGTQECIQNDRKCIQSEHDAVSEMNREIENIETIEIIEKDTMDFGENLICPESKDEQPLDKRKAYQLPDGTYISGDGKPGRRIRDLTEAEGRAIKQKLKEGIAYLDIEREYGMRVGTITAKFPEYWKDFCYKLVNGLITD